MKLKHLLLLFTFYLCTFNILATTHTIQAGNYYYTPSVLNVNLGDTVNWINNGGFHNVNFDVSTITGASFGNPVNFITAPTTSANMASYIFTVAGTYNYDCSVGTHAANGMTGTVIVNSASNKAE